MCAAAPILTNQNGNRTGTSHAKRAGRGMELRLRTGLPTDAVGWVLPADDHAGQAVGPAGMNRHLILALVAVMAISACAMPAGPPPSPTPTDTAMGNDLADEINRLRRALAADAPASIPPDAKHEAVWAARASAELARSGVAIDTPQLVVIVDRAPSVQALLVMLAQPNAPWRMIGGDKVSTGQAGRTGYFITPTGVFGHTDGIVGYRALGTPNESGIRGLGGKGMRVWDFGWQQAAPGWGADRAPRDIRMLLHATDPVYLEPRLGRPASKGCIRVSTAMNRFLDRFGVLDAAYERAAPTDPRIARVLLPERTPTWLAGEWLIIIDSSAETATSGEVEAPTDGPEFNAPGAAAAATACPEGAVR
jgi:hypothetical protein